MIALLAGISGAWAEDVTSYDGEFYYIHNNNGTDKYVGSDYKCKTTSTYGTIFRIKQVTHNDATCYTIYNMGTGKYVNYKDANEGTTKLESGNLGDKSYWDIAFVSGTAVTICPQGSSYSWNFWGGNSDGNPVGLYSSGDGNSKWRLEKVAPVSSAAGLGAYKYGVISLDRGGWAVNGATATQLQSTADLSLAVAIDTKQQFAFVPYNEKYYLYSVVAGKFVKKDGSLTLGAGDPVTIVETNNASYPLFFKFDDGHNINLGGSSQMIINGWGTIDNGNSVALLPEGAYSLTAATNVLNGTTPVINATYKVYYDDTQKKEDVTIDALGGYAPSLPSSLKAAYCTYTYYSDAERKTPMATLPTSDCTVYVDATWDGPFDFSSNFASAKWYYMTVHEKYVQNDGNNPYALSNSKVMGTKAHWAFLGNPYDGVQIINELAGDGKYLDDGTHPQMGTTGTEWILTESSTSGAFQLHVGANKYINNNGGLSYWDTTSAINASGSLLRVEDIPDDMLSDYIANIAPYINYYGNGYFMLTEAEATALYGKFTSYYGDSKISDIEYDDMLTYLKNNINYPNSGYYVISNDNSSMYMGFPNDGADYTHLKKYGDLGINTIAKLEKQTDNTYFISFQGKYLYCYGHNQYIDGFTSYRTKVSGSVESNSVVLKSSGCYVCVDETGLYGKNTTDVSAKWTVSDAAGTELSISLNKVGSKSYATFSAPFPVTIGDGAKAYTIDLDAANNRAVCSEITSKQIPAGAGILLISETAASSVTATVNATDFSALEGNDLRGYYLPSTYSAADETNYNLVLGVGADNGTIGFYQMGEGTASANKAYLPYPKGGGGGVKGFALISAEELETGINNLKPTQKSESIYDLSGRRVSKPTRGLYIKNGQKIAVK